MAVLYLTEREVAELLDMRTPMDVVKQAFDRWAAGEADNVPRVRAKGRGIVLHSMSAAADYLGVVGWKNYTTTRSGARFHTALYDSTSGEMIALIESDWLGRLRTGATTGVAAEWMAAPNASDVGIFGAGKQAATQLSAIATARAVKQAYVYSRDEPKRAAFAEEQSAALGIEVIPVDRPQDAAEDVSIVVTATTSRVPVFACEWLSEGTFVAAIGSNWPDKAEIDDVTIRRADRIVCDDVEACRSEAGDFRAALEAGTFDWSRAVNLTEVVAGRAPGRGAASEITLFKSVGLAIEDIALAAKAVERARAFQRGHWIEWPR